jgi:hypothetical protein
MVSLYLHHLVLSQSRVFSEAVNTLNDIRAFREGEYLNYGFHGFDTMLFGRWLLSFQR